MSRQWDLVADVAIAGGGACGLTVAATVASALPSAELVVLEKDASSPCNAAIGGAYLMAASTRFQREAGIDDDTPELMAADIAHKNQGRCDRDLVMELCRKSASVVEWLADEIKVPIELAPETVWIGHSRPRMHAHPARSGAPIVQALREYALSLPNLLFADTTPGRSLITADHGDVIGIEAGSDDMIQRVGARKVVLATGGFAANQELMKRWIPSMVGAPYAGASTNTGDGILMGVSIGAALEHIHAFQGLGFVVAGYGTRLNPGVVSAGGIMVDVTGRRFEREDQGYSEWAEIVNRQPERLAIAIWDQSIHKGLEITGAMRNSMAAGAIVRCDSVEELADRFRIDPNTLATTIADYNRGVVGSHDAFGREMLKSTLEPPLFAARVVGALAHTQGGLKIDTSGRVIGTKGSVIPNLYAGGGDAAGISGDRADGYTSGNGLVTAYVLGRIIGKQIVAALHDNA